MNTVRNVVKNSTMLILSHIISKTLFFFIIIMFTRLLGVEGFGQLSFAMSFVLLFTVFTDLGLNMLSVREVSRDRENAEKYFFNGLILKVLLTIIAYCLIITVITFVSDNSTAIKTVYIFGIYMMVEALYLFIRSFLRAFEKMEYEAYINAFSRIVILIFAVIALKNNWDVTRVASIYLIASVVSLISSAAFMFKKKHMSLSLFVNNKIDIGFCWDLLKEAWPFAIMMVFGVVYGRVDTVMLKVIKGDMAVGWYSAAYRLIEGMTFIPQMFVVSIFPVFSRLFKDSKQKLVLAYEKSFEFLFIIGFPIVVGGTLLSRKIIYLFYGADFGNSAIVLQVLIWVLLFSLNSDSLSWRPFSRCPTRWIS